MRNLLFLLLIVLAACNGRRNDAYSLDGPPPSTLSFEDLGSGVLTAEGAEVYEDDLSVSGNTISYYDLAVKNPSTRFKGEIGAIFGIHFRINHENYVPLEITRTWAFPQPIAMEGEEPVRSVTRSEVIYTNEPVWMYYTIEEEKEIVPGRWVLTYEYQGEVLFRKSFHMQ